MKHVPQRTCIACHTVRSKRELVRVVRTTTHGVVADATGKMAGRGAYLCRARECWEQVLGSRGRLEHALKLDAPLGPQELLALQEYAATLPLRSEDTAVAQKQVE